MMQLGQLSKSNGELLARHKKVRNGELVARHKRMFIDEKSNILYLYVNSVRFMWL